MWFSVLLPRIHAFVPAGTILEIAPGYGRWTQYLKDLCDRLIIVDLAENCIDHCRRRFSAASNIEYHVNDGRSLDAVADGSVDFVFSFDSLVHVEADVLAAYLKELTRKLKPDGVGFFHHSNIGSYRAMKALVYATPERLRRPLAHQGVLLDLFRWRAESVTADGFAGLCADADLACVAQEKITWEDGPWLIDALSVFTPRGSRWDRPRVVMENRRFHKDAARLGKLYGRTSFPA